MEDLKLLKQLIQGQRYHLKSNNPNAAKVNQPLINQLLSKLNISIEDINANLTIKTNTKATKVKRSRKSFRALIYANKHTKTVYIARLFNDSESFYKIGVCIDPRKRLASISPYQTELIRSMHFPTVEQALETEDKLLKSQTPYQPKHKFKGYTECVKTLPSIK